jgi:hypothetical protein
MNIRGMTLKKLDALELAMAWEEEKEGTNITERLSV